MLSSMQHENESFILSLAVPGGRLEEQSRRTNHDSKRTCTKCRFLALERLYLKCYQGRFLSTSHSVGESGDDGRVWQ
jgi:hypothetical protein